MQNLDYAVIPIFSCISLVLFVILPATSEASGVSAPIAREFVPRRGASYRIDVSQGGMDVEVTVSAAEFGSRSFDSPLFGDELEHVLIENASDSVHRIELVTKQSTASKYSPVIRIIELDKPAAKLRAWRLITKAAEGNASGDRGRQTLAIDQYLAAAKLWKEFGNHRERAHALYAAAMLNYWVVGEWYTADKLAAEAAEAYASIDESELEANATLLRAMTLTEALNNAVDKPTILDQINAYLSRSYSVHEALGNDRQLAKIRYFNGLSHLNAGLPDKAKLYYEEAAALYDRANDWHGLRRILLDIAVIEIDAGNSAVAVAALEELLKKNTEENSDFAEGDRNFTATVHDQLAAAYKHNGNFDAALNSFSVARDMHHRADDLHGEAESLRGMAGIYVELGDLASAKDLLRQAEEVATTSNNGRILGLVHTTFGHIEYVEKDFEAARRSQEEALKFTGDEDPIRAHRQILLARTLVAMTEYDRAIDIAADALTLAAKVQSPRAEADALQQMGKAYLGRQQVEESIACLKEALDIYEALALTNGLLDVEQALANSFAYKARTSSGDDAIANLDLALSWSARSLRYMDGLLDSVSAPELRAHYAAARRTYFGNHIDLLLERSKFDQGSDNSYVSAALSTSEQARARMTMDLLAEAAVDLQQDVDPGVAAEMDELIQRLAVISRRRDRILLGREIDDQDRATLTALSAEIALIRNQLNVHQIALRQASARYSALTSPEHTELHDIQDLIGPNSVMLQYYLGDSGSHLWIVSDESVQVIELAARSVIDQAAERAIASLRSQRFDSAGRTEQREALSAVADLVLLPAANLIGDKRLVIVADGALNYLPFQVLPLDGETGPEPLMQQREVILLPSMSVLAALRNRSLTEELARSIAIFADPVFSETDSRMQGIISEASTGGSNRGSTSSDSNDSRLHQQLPRLEGTRAEALAISGLVSADDAMLNLGFDASKEAVLGAPLADYRYLHFATHGKIDSQTPRLSSLALSQFDEFGRSADGYLRLHDIYRLELNADLVVLSACETGLGADIQGEGLIGLTQGFLYAGARSLLISLWDVPDRPTSELMIRFYHRILNDGARPSAALRLAQLSMASERRWRNPYFWGGFVLLGDWQ